MKHLKISTNTKTTNHGERRLETHKADASDFSSDDENVPATVMTNKSALTDMCNAKDHSATGGNINLGTKV